MVARNENTIKLIYAIQDITLMIISNIFGIWSNGRITGFRGSHPDGDYREVRVNGNAPCVIEGDDNYMITRNADALGYCKTLRDGP